MRVSFRTETLNVGKLQWCMRRKTPLLPDVINHCVFVPIVYNPNHSIHLNRYISSNNKGISSNSDQKHAVTSEEYWKQRLSVIPAKEWWEKNKDLVSRRKNSTEPLFVFLEGPAGSGKREVLSRLNKMGFTTYNTSFLNKHCIDRYPRPNWLYAAEIDHSAELIKFLEYSIEKHKKIPHKQNVCFLNRSFLSRFAFKKSTNNNIDEDYFINTMKSIRESYNTAVLLCVRDTDLIAPKLAERKLVAEDKEKNIREELGESNIKNTHIVFGRYINLEESGLIDERLETTSTKQGTAHILKMLGIEMEWFGLSNDIMKKS